MHACVCVGVCAWSKFRRWFLTSFSGETCPQLLTVVNHMVKPAPACHSFSGDLDVMKSSPAFDRFSGE